MKTKEDELKQHSDLPRRIIGMKNKFVSVYIIIGIWVVVFLLARIMPLNTYFSNKGMDYINGEYYRYLTAEFCHINLFHLLVNCLGLYYITIYLNDIVNEIVMIVIGIVGGFVADFVFSIVIHASEESMGGSAFVFPIIGIILFLKLFDKNMPPFKLGTYYGNWTVGYAVIGNIVNGKMEVADYTTILLHAAGFVAGFLLAIPCKKVLRKDN